MGIFVNTNQNVQIEYRISSLSNRILAYLIDGAVLFGLTIAILFFAVMANAGDIMYLFFVPIFFYHFICEMTMDGQSIGKRAMKIKVMKTDGRDASFSNYLLRFLLRPIDTIYAIGLAVIFFTEKGQRLGDLAAGTMIVDVPQPVALQNIGTEKANTPFQTIQFPEAAQLKDSDIELINKILEKYKTDFRNEAILLLADKIQTLLDIKTELKPFMFLRTIVRDFNSIHG